MKNNQVIETDWTKQSGPTIVKCSKCGRKGKSTTYKDGTQLFCHKQKVQLGFPIVTDYCYIGKNK